MHDLTILIPIYNEEKYILETLLSLIEQTYRNFLCVLSDNNSSDKSEEICNKIVAKDKRFIYFKHDVNLGITKNVEFLLSKITSEYVMIFAGHDLIEKEFLSKTLNVLKMNDDVSLSFSKSIAIDENSNIIKEKVAIRYDFTGNALSRYIHSVKELGECTIFQGIFRAKVLENFSFTESIPGGDQIFISHLLWYGKLHITEESTYKRRYFLQKTTTYAERNSGDIKQKLSFSLMYQTYLDDFNSLYKGPENYRAFLNNKILDILTLRYGLGYLYHEDYK